jgi:UDP:flavonoid glycosyltransferase YjiC (YdhE family)
VERWVNPADVLAQADAAVSHGGFGTTLGAVAAGLPLVVVPLFGDQPDNASRIEAVGAGVVIWPEPGGPPVPIRTSIDPTPLREAVETVLGDPAYARVASELAGEMAALPSTDEVLGVFAHAR